MFRFLPLILKNCWRNRRRTILTIASIGVSMCLLGVMIAMYHALYLSDATPEQALRLVTRNRISLTVADAAVVPDAHPADSGRARGHDLATGSAAPTRRPRTSSRASRWSRRSSSRSTARLQIPDDQRKAFERDRTGCVIGRDLANKFNLQVGDRMHLVGDIFPGDFEFTIAGIFDSPRASEVMYFNREYLEQTLPERRRGKAGMFATLIDDPDVGAAASRRPSTRSSATPPRRPRPNRSRQYRLGFLSLLGNVKMFLMAICAAVMFTILLVSANTMAMSVRERVREVGVLKTLGFTDGDDPRHDPGRGLAISLAGRRDRASCSPPC